MARYIDADIIPYSLENEGNTTIEYAYKSDIDNVPTADARPERHGRWIKDYMDTVGYGSSCTYCGCFFEDIKGIEDYDFCPNCGAKMDDNDAYSSLS